jgi:hypothetical protein
VINQVQIILFDSTFTANQVFLDYLRPVNTSL